MYNLKVESYVLFEDIRASLVAQMVKHLPAMQETWVRFLDWEGLLEEGMVGYSPWGCKESDMTERLSIAQHSTVR